jgi:hypothetical protein
MQNFCRDLKVRRQNVPRILAEMDWLLGKSNGSQVGQPTVFRVSQCG